MVGVAQLVEPRIVTPVVVGSIPIAHPITFPNIGILLVIWLDGRQMHQYISAKKPL